jgi:hypothetical protein
MDDETTDLGGPSVASRGCGLVGCLLIGALLAAIVISAVALGGALEPLADRFLWGPHDVVREYFAAHRREDAARMQHLTCVGAGQLNPLFPFEFRAGSPYVEDEFPYPRDGGRVAIYYRLEPRGERAQALLEREDAGWRVCEFARG